ncbi:Uncharacterized membrane protein [Devosia lucknowensis]|uniref:Uncharacterized membrane protein n=1 Tax=Devosia lucknowensis TaxID=1096929 RepID=A0A1Y6G9B3_9HYPH|nr:DUF2244 domain-containing protein [Devosia lucknowensis]SMQ85963.1 Uncharacterized membrane protein [Devosia lucknowensis]
MQVTTTTPLFAATLRPEHSLRMAGGWIALTLAGIVGTPFLLAIPAFLLPGLLAFGIAAGSLVVLGLRQARRKRTSQQVTLWPDQLEVATQLPGAEKQLQRFNPKQIRLRLERDQFERTTGVFLRLGTDETELGSFLSATDKGSFARAFGAALRQARRTG